MSTISSNTQMIAVIVMITLREPYSTKDSVIGGVKPTFGLIGLAFDIFQFHFCFLCRSALLHIELRLRRISFIVLIAYHQGPDGLTSTQYFSQHSAQITLTSGYQINQNYWLSISQIIGKFKACVYSYLSSRGTRDL